MAENGKIDFKIFLDEYLTDAREGFQTVNNALLTLEKDFTRIDLIDEIFRVVHTLKSSSKMLEFAAVTDFAHLCEDFIDSLRRHELPLNQNAVDLLFEITDTLEMMIREQTGSGKSGVRSPEFEEEDSKKQIYITSQRTADIKHKIESLASQDMLARQAAIVINEQGVVESFNQSAEKMFGYASSEVLGQKVNILMPEPYRSKHDTFIKNYIETGKAKIIGLGREVMAMKKDGAEFPIEFAVNELQLPEKRLFVGIIKSIARHEPKSVTAASIEKIQTVRINVEILDSLFNLVGELIISKNRMNNLIADTDKKEIKLTMATIVHIIDELQEKVSEARMVPGDEVFRKFPRMVRDLAASAGKEIDLVVEGSGIELDKSVLDAIGEPLIHLLRNALDHGIEPPEERQNFGKKRKGLVRLIARRAENHILIEVGDDGRGIDIPLMRDIAVKKGFTKTEEIGLLEDKDILKLIFKPGFSSSENVTEVSGRGVGLDIVKSVTERLNGMVEVATEKGRGTRFILKLPISPAIIQTLMVSVGNHVFAIPSDMAIETLEIGNEDIKEIKDREVLVIKNEILPFIRLSSVLGVQHNVDQKKIAAVIIHVGDVYIGIGVDSVLGQMENIVKPFDPIAQGFRGFSGGTILGDGSIALLLDIPKLLGFEKLKEERYAV